MFVTMARKNSPECRDRLSCGKQVLLVNSQRSFLWRWLEVAIPICQPPDFPLCTSGMGTWPSDELLLKCIYWSKHIVVFFTCLHSMQWQAWNSISILFFLLWLYFIYMEKKPSSNLTKNTEIKENAFVGFTCFSHFHSCSIHWSHQYLKFNSYFLVNKMSHWWVLWE